MFLLDAWEFIREKVSEGFEEFLDMFSGMFSNLNEFSIPGAVAGALMVFLLFVTRGIFMDRFPVGIPTKIVCYVAVFIVGYLFMKSAFDK